MTTQRATMFYDGACPLCRREVAHYRRLDSEGRVRWVDISEDSSLLAPHGISAQQAMARLHALDGHGNVVHGVRAFATIWAELPYYRWLSRLVQLPGILPLMDAAYLRFARWRLRRRRCSDNQCGT